nr:copia protein [Tanacetum cinerariifolium]
MNKAVKVEEHHRNLLLSKKNKCSSSTCNNSKIDSLDVISKVVCAIYKKCLISINHDECLVNYVSGKKSRGRKHRENVSKSETQKAYQRFVYGASTQWGNILITRVYFVEGLGHNLFSVGQFCDSDLDVAFRRNACFVRNLEGIDLFKRNRSTNLYTINLHEMASA